MPTPVGIYHSPEDYEEWLGRLEEDDLLPSDYDTFVRTLRGELERPDGSKLDYSDGQIEALWNQKTADAPYSEHGVTAVTIRYPWGSEVRYGIQGMKGLFGWDRLQEIRSQEEW